MELEGNRIPWVFHGINSVLALVIIFIGTSFQGDALGFARHIVYYMYESVVLWHDVNAELN